MYEKVGNQQQFLLAWFQKVLLDQGYWTTINTSPRKKMRYWNAPPNNRTIRIQFLNDDVDGSLAPAALVGRPVDVVSGVLPSQRLDRQRNREFVNQPDAWGRAGAGQDGLSVFEPGDGQGYSAFDDGAGPTALRRSKRRRPSASNMARLFPNFRWHLPDNKN